jgi:hypothetical protein
MPPAQRPCLFLSAALMLTLSGARATTIHVKTDGDDSAAGSGETPLKTIQEAASRAGAGDTVIVHAGYYSGHVIVSRSGEPGKPIVFRSATGARPVFDGEGEGRIELKAEEGWQKPIGHITIEGFEIRNGWDGIKFYNAHHIILRNNQIHSNLNQGILGNGHHVLIEGNIIYRNGLKPGNERSNLEHGIYCTGTDFTIVNNIIHSNKAYGIQVAGYPYDAEKHPGTEFAGARRWLISNNTFAFQQNRAGIVIWQHDATDCIVQNNIFYRNSVTLDAGATQGIDFVSSGGGHVIRNNLFFAPERSSTHSDASATNSVEQEDPAFVDPERFEFHIAKGSPATDAGFAEHAPATDLEGNPRPQGRGVDLGAYEGRE